MTFLTGNKGAILVRLRCLKFFWFYTFIRWNYFETVLKKENIEIMGYSSDGDSRLLKAMKVKNALSDFSVNCQVKWRRFFNAQFNSDYQCFQDSIHIANKLKNRFLKKPVMSKGGKLIPVIPIIIGK